jgi:hypothetical protein
MYSYIMSAKYVQQQPTSISPYNDQRMCLNIFIYAYPVQSCSHNPLSIIVR